jgi:hypothetical protein
MSDKDICVREITSFSVLANVYLKRRSKDEHVVEEAFRQSSQLGERSKIGARL